MNTTLEQVKKLRDLSGAGLSDCKDALDASAGDMDTAFDYLRKKGMAKAQKRALKATNNGFIGSYIHNGKIGVLVELNCETDFVARNEKFQVLARDIAMHIAAASPVYLDSTQVPQNIVDKEKEIYREELIKEGKPENIVESIVEGKLNKFYSEVCLLNQNFVKDESKTIEDMINDSIASIGEKIVIGKFSRIEIGLN